jgi:hypothetical protein
MEHERGHRLSVASRRKTVLKQLAGQAIGVPRPREVGAYLRQYPDLAELVLMVCAEARREFGSLTELSLEMYSDPEIDDFYLTLYVRQPTYETDLLARIHRIADTYEKDLARKSGHFLITTDFRAPRNSHGL